MKRALSEAVEYTTFGVLAVMLVGGVAAALSVVGALCYWLFPWSLLLVVALCACYGIGRAAAA